MLAHLRNVPEYSLYGVGVENRQRMLITPENDAVVNYLDLRAPAGEIPLDERAEPRVLAVGDDEYLPDDTKEESFPDWSDEWESDTEDSGNDSEDAFDDETDLESDQESEIVEGEVFSRTELEGKIKEKDTIIVDFKDNDFVINKKN